MRIAVDIQPLATESAGRGMGVYTLGMLEALFRIDTENEYFLFSLYGDNAAGRLKLPGHVHYRRFYSGEGCYLLENGLYGDGMGMKYDGLIEGVYQTFIREHGIDVFLVTSPFDLLMLYRKKWFAPARVACVFYDLVPFLFGEQYLTDEWSRLRYESGLEFVKSADLLLAISQCAKDDAIRYLALEEKKITVIHAGAGDTFYQKRFDGETVRAVMEKYGIGGRLLLFPSGDDFRKNATGAVQAYAALPQALRDEYQLVVTGKLPEAEMPEIKTLCMAGGMSGRVVFTGYVASEELLLLYNNAALVLFPSLYEGFGLPVVEAFKCGKNVVTSRNSSLGEVAEGAAVLVDPYDPADIARGIEEALRMGENPSFERVKRERIARYTWDNVARLARDAVRALKPAAPPAGRRRVALFTPLPPAGAQAAKTGERMLAALERHCDVDVFVGDGSRSDRRLHVINYRAFDKMRKKYDGVVFHLANEAECLYMLPALLKYGGTLALEDIDLHAALYRACGAGEMDWSVYEMFLREEVAHARLFTRRVRQDAEFARVLQSEVQLNRKALDAAGKIIVKSEAQRGALLQKNLGYCIRVQPDGFDSPDALDFLFGPQKKYTDDADLAHVCTHEIALRELDAESEIGRVAETFAYVMRGGDG
jgi:glycosyltransferase involved in cell wall biosynthesis